MFELCIWYSSQHMWDFQWPMWISIRQGGWYNIQLRIRKWVVHKFAELKRKLILHNIYSNSTKTKTENVYYQLTKLSVDFGTDKWWDKHFRLKTAKYCTIKWPGRYISLSLVFNVLFLESLMLLMFSHLLNWCTCPWRESSAL